MKRNAALPLVLLPLLLAGCGGSPGGTGVVYSLTPERATVAAGGSVALRAGVAEGTYTDLGVSVREGAAGGSVVTTGSSPTSTVDVPGGALYTAPREPGTYHVVVRFLNGARLEATRTATITVDVAP